MGLEKNSETNNDHIFALIVDGGTLGINLKKQKGKRTMRKTKVKTESTSDKQIDHLTRWEWETLVASWRYYEYRTTIASATFPADIIERFFKGGKYSKNIKEMIAHQFAHIDHGLRGEDDWTKDKTLRDCDRIEWLKFFRFCEGFVNGWHKVVLDDGKTNKEVDAFHVDFNDRWYSVKHYIKNPYTEQYCAPEFIVSIDGNLCPKEKDI